MRNCCEQQLNQLIELISHVVQTFSYFTILSEMSQTTIRKSSSVFGNDDDDDGIDKIDDIDKFNSIVDMT